VKRIRLDTAMLVVAILALSLALVIEHKRASVREAELVAELETR
jgi:hypothetical protein